MAETEEPEKLDFTTKLIMFMVCVVLPAALAFDIVGGDRGQQWLSSMIGDVAPPTYIVPG